MKILTVLGFVATSLVGSHAMAECVVSRDEVQKAIDSGASTDELQKKFEGCKAQDQWEPTSLQQNKVNGQYIKNTGSVAYESLLGCGYHPQRKELTCPIEIRRQFGYGGTPALQPAGSYEYVLFCIQTANGLAPVNTNGVHVHDESFGNQPNWYTAAVVPANQPLFSTPLLGQSLRARAILSWGIPPQHCNWQPIWGNQADFIVRLDP